MVKNLPVPLAAGQKGAVLVVSLIMLLIMTLIGLSSMQSTTLEEKMAGNYRDQNIAFQAAESTLREGEGWIAALTEEPLLSVADCSANCDVWDVNTLLSALSASSYMDETLWGDPLARTATNTIPGVAASPEFFIEFQQYKRDSLNLGQQGDMSVRIYYGVVAKGVGGRDSTQAVLQSSYTRRF
jgi:type IV pilus assembly protein PilX